MPPLSPIPDPPVLQEQLGVPPQPTLDDPDDEKDETLGPDSMPGYERVEALASYLDHFCQDRGVITNQQGNRIIELWNALHRSDKTVRVPPHHQQKFTKGRFKHFRGMTVIPGNDGTCRCFLGENTGPAVPGLMPTGTRSASLTSCALMYPGQVRHRGHSIQGWSLIMTAYKNIRDKVLSSSPVGVLSP
ncbi:uncharacterized protein LOC110989812 [Acanthaster planci]|uniref:Uncharacterized protein LOC110989812 n=1 Tax=Acanthaster planci TaxID=133434 RepID=A0A8B7ZYH4_ACAPL|nr:uncharacterized protein LOC110989812 [Acanthaster planci]